MVSYNAMWGDDMVEVKTFQGNWVAIGDTVCYLKTIQKGNKKRRYKCTGKILNIRASSVIISVESIDSYVDEKEDYIGKSFVISQYSDIICKMKDEETDG